MSIEDVASGVKLAYWDLNKAAYQTARGLHRKAQHAGMRYQNWRHKGAGEPDGTALETAPNSARMDGQTLTPRKPGKSWSSDEQYESTTYMNTTTYRKRTR